MSESFTTAQREAYNISLTWHEAAMLPDLRRRTRDEVKAIAEAASELAMGYPLQFAGAKQFEIKVWRDGEKLSGAQVFALLACGVYLLAGDDERNGFALLESSPWMRDALMLASEAPRG